MGLVIGFFVLLSICAVGFVVFILFDGLRSVKSINKNGVNIIATITEIKANKKRDKSGAVYDDKTLIKCEFEYQGKHELELHYNYKLDVSNLKEGDKIAVVYDIKHNWISTKENVKSSGNFLLIGILLIVILIFGGSFDLEKFGNEIIKIANYSISISDIILIIAFIIWECFAIKSIDKNYIKGDYIKLKGRVTDIHVKYNSGSGSDNIGVDVYAPEVTFNYNGKEIKKVSGWWTNANKYKINQELIVYYNPETDMTYAKGNNTFFIIMALLGLLFLIPIIKMFI